MRSYQRYPNAFATALRQIIYNIVANGHGDLAVSIALMSVEGSRLKSVWKVRSWTLRVPIGRAGKRTREDATRHASAPFSLGVAMHVRDRRE